MNPLKWSGPIPKEALAVMEFWLWSAARGLPRKNEKRRIYTHEEILSGEWKKERDGREGM